MIDDEPDYEDREQQRLEREEIDPYTLYRAQQIAYRAMHRPFRSAFRGGLIAGERQRRIMGHVGQCHARGLS